MEENLSVMVCWDELLTPVTRHETSLTLFGTRVGGDDKTRSLDRFSKFPDFLPFIAACIPGIETLKSLYRFPEARNTTDLIFYV